MPHFDFRQALSSSADPVDPSTPPIRMDLDAITGTDSRGNESHRQRQERLLAQSDRMSLLFALLVFSGGLFCAFYFFNGTELLRTVKALPGELLYPRPSAETQPTQTAKIDMFNHGREQGSRLAGSSAESSDRRAKPLDSSVGSAHLNPFLSQATPRGSNGSSPTAFSPLSNPSSGSNALRSGAAASSRTSAQAVTNVAQAKVSGVSRAAIQLPKRARAPLKSKSAKHQTLAKTKANAARIAQNVQHTSRLTGSAQNDAARSRTTNSGAGNLGRANLGALGHAGGGGGLGGGFRAGAPMSLPGGH